MGDPIWDMEPLRRFLAFASPADRAEMVRTVCHALRELAPDELRAEETRARTSPEPAERFER